MPLQNKIKNARTTWILINTKYILCIFILRYTGVVPRGGVALYQFLFVYANETGFKHRCWVWGKGFNKREPKTQFMHSQSPLDGLQLGADCLEVVSLVGVLIPAVPDDVRHHFRGGAQLREAWSEGNVPLLCPHPLHDFWGESKTKKAK